MIRTVFYIFIVVTFSESKKISVPRAIFELVEGRYGGSSVKIEVFYNSRSLTILDETIKLLSQSKNIKVTEISTKDVIAAEINENKTSDIFANDAIFLFDTVENYWKFRAQMGNARAEQEGEQIKFLIYCEDSTREKLAEILTQEAFESFLLEENNKITLNSVTMFTEKMCKVPQLIEINQFSDLDRKWSTDKFYAPLVENFHGCELQISYISHTSVNLPFYDLTRRQDNGEYINDGVIVKMVEALSSHLNFTIKHGGMHPDFVFGAFIYHTTQLFDPKEMSDPIWTTSHVFVVPPGESYTSWEKTLLPFDEETWMWLGIVFSVAFSVIFLIRLLRSTSMYDLIIGSNVTAPFLNVVGIFMGIGQLFLPQRNVTRLLLTNFVLFCLIIRTAYQGMYFEFLTMDVRKKPVATVAELKERNFTVIIEENESNYFRADDLNILKG